MYRKYIFFMPVIIIALIFLFSSCKGSSSSSDGSGTTQKVYQSATIPAAGGKIVDEDEEWTWKNDASMGMKLAFPVSSADVSLYAWRGHDPAILHDH